MALPLPIASTVSWRVVVMVAVLMVSRFRYGETTPSGADNHHSRHTIGESQNRPNPGRVVKTFHIRKNRADRGGDHPHVNFFSIPELQNPEAHYLALGDEPFEELNPPIVILRGEVELPGNTALLRFFNNHRNIL
jgi:hypothetical protein